MQTQISNIIFESLDNHISNKSPETLQKVKEVFSHSRKFSQKEAIKLCTTTQALNFKPRDGFFDCNPFSIPSDQFKVDLLTDSGTGRLTEEQIQLKKKYIELIPSIEVFSYARCTPREHLEQVTQKIFGDNYQFYPSLQGRAAERMLINALLETEYLKHGDQIISNRPFDTTKGHIQNSKLDVKALTPLSSPKEYYDSDTVFMGDIQKEVFDKEDEYKVLLMTMTDNGGGGQPVSMDNFKYLAEETHKKGKLVWIDGCRIFENALFIKAFDSKYESHTITDIVRELLSYCDVATMSFKKMYAHSGGGTLINKNSKILNEKLIKNMDFSIKRQTTTDYGNGYRSYSGLTGDGMVEIISGLLLVTDEAIVGSRIAQVGYVGAYLHDKYNFPIISGGHAMYIAADQVLPSVPIENCPAEYLNAIMMKSIQTRGCGLGYLIYGKRTTTADPADNNKEIIEYQNKLTMDSLRLAVPRCEYSDEYLISYLSVIGQAFADGQFRNLDGGLYPIEYVDNGFYHFGGSYDIIKSDEFVNITESLIASLNN